MRYILFYLLLLNSCSQPNALDEYLRHTEQIYTKLLINAKIERIDEDEYNNVNSNEIKFYASGKGSVRQKIGDLGTNIKAYYQKIESKDSKKYLKITGDTDHELQQIIAQVALLGIKCYDYNKNTMGLDCKNQGLKEIMEHIDIIEINKNLVDIEKLMQKKQIVGNEFDSIAFKLTSIIDKNNSILNDSINQKIHDIKILFQEKIKDNDIPVFLKNEFNVLFDYLPDSLFNVDPTNPDLPYNIHEL